MSGHEKRLRREVRLCEQDVGQLDYVRHEVSAALTEARNELREAHAKLREYLVKLATRKASR